MLKIPKIINNRAITGIKMNIALIGLRGTGKTAVAKLLAKKLDRKLISTDEEITKKAGTSISKFVRKYGLEKLRDIESNITESISDFDDCIFDTGSGIVMRNENIINLKKSALIVLLTTDARTMMDRLKNRQPLAKGYADEIKRMLQVQESRYQKAADYTIDTSRLSPEEVCDLIIHYVQLELQ